MDYPEIRRRAMWELKIQGWLAEEQALALWSLACASCRPIVEIGTYCGLSTAFLAASGNTVYTIDPNEWAQSKAKLNMSILGLDGKVVFLNGCSRDMLRLVPSDIGMLFVDGNHTAECVASDLRLYSPLVDSDGVCGG